MINKYSKSIATCTQVEPLLRQPIINIQWCWKQIESGGGGAKLISNLDKQQKKNPQDYGYVYIKRIKKKNLIF